MAKKSTGHSPKYDLVKFYYDEGACDIDKVRKAVVKGWITEDEFKEITGENY